MCGAAGWARSISVLMCGSNQEQDDSIMPFLKNDCALSSQLVSISE